MRFRAALWRVAVIVGWAGGVAAAAELDYPVVLVAAIPLTLLAGASLDSWWAIAVPWGVLVVLFTIAVALDPSCSECGEDPWTLQLLYGAMVACPASVLMAIGVGARRLARLARRGSPRPEPRAP
jgi:hypothetical protein